MSLNAWRKMRKACWFVSIRCAQYFHPRVATRISVAFYRRSGMTILGDPSFSGLNVWFDSTQDYSLITLHAGCTISRDVRFLTHDWSPNTAFRAYGRMDATPLGRIDQIEVGENAFIGIGCILLPGSRIGKGAIVGAGTVVRGTVEPFTIVAGNPMRVLGPVETHLRRHYADAWAALPPNADTFDATRASGEP